MGPVLLAALALAIDNSKSTTLLWRKIRAVGASVVQFFTPNLKVVATGTALVNCDALRLLMCQPNSVQVVLFRSTMI